MKLSDLTVDFVLDDPVQSLSIAIQSALRNLSAELWLWIGLLLLLAVPLIYDALTKSNEVNATFERYKTKNFRVDVLFKSRRMYS